MILEGMKQNRTLRILEACRLRQAAAGALRGFETGPRPGREVA
jgi:hypothetical protein